MLFTKSFSNGSVPVTILALVSIHFKLFSFFQYGVIYVAFPQPNSFCPIWSLVETLFICEEIYLEPPGRRGGEKYVNECFKKRGAFDIQCLWTAVCWIFEITLGAEHFGNNINLLFQQKHFSHRLTLLEHIYFPPQYNRLYLSFYILPPSQIFLIPFNFPLFGELRVFLFLRKRKMKEVCEGRASQFVYFGFNIFSSSFWWKDSWNHYP